MTVGALPETGTVPRQLSTYGNVPKVLSRMRNVYDMVLPSQHESHPTEREAATK